MSRPLGPRHRPARRLLALALALGGVLALTDGGPAAADPELDRARARASELAGELERLESQAGVAAEDWAAAQIELGRVVNDVVAAQKDLDAINLALSAGSSRFARQVREIYLSGGSAGVLPTLLASGSANDMLSNVDLFNSVLDAQRAMNTDSASVLAQRETVTRRLEFLTEQRTVAEQRASTERSNLDERVAEKQAAVAAAGGEVLALAAAEQARRDAEAVARARVLVAGANVLPHPLPPATPAAAAAIREAAAQIGKPYVYAGNGPDTFDCSGLTVWAYRSVGVSLPRTSREQWNMGAHPALDEMQPGDLLFWAYDTSDPGTIHHVAIYLGAGWMIHAPHTGDVVRYARIYLDGFIGAVRLPGV